MALKSVIARATVRRRELQSSQSNHDIDFSSAHSLRFIHAKNFSLGNFGQPAILILETEVRMMGYKNELQNIGYTG